MPFFGSAILRGWWSIHHHRFACCRVIPSGSCKTRMIEHVMATRRAMAKMKSGDISSDRGNDELREMDVTLDFTPNPLSSLLYKQGDTIVLICVTKAPRFHGGFQRTLTEGGFTPSIPYFPARQIPDSGERGMVPRAGLWRLKD